MVNWAWHSEIPPWLPDCRPPWADGRQQNWLLTTSGGQGWALCGRLCEGLWPMQLHENLPCIPFGRLMPNWVPDHQWQVISVDLIMELQPSQGYNAIMVVVDHLLKRAHIIHTTSDVMASGVAQLFRDHRWKLHGLPEEVISDQGTQFVSSFTCSLSQLLGIWVVAPQLNTPMQMGRLKESTRKLNNPSGSWWTNGRMIGILAGHSQVAYNDWVTCL